MEARATRSGARGASARLAAAVLVAMIALVAVAPTQPAAASGSDVASYIARINQLRTSQGLAPLQEDGTLDALAERWAYHLADIDGLQHAADLSVGVDRPWVKLGENVGLGPDTGTIFAAFVNSPSHYRNLVDPTFTHVGVGVVWLGGTQYTVHRFLAAGGAPQPVEAPEPEPQVRAALPEVTPAAPAVAEPAPEPVPVLAPPPADAPRPSEAPERFAAVAQALARA